MKTLKKHTCDLCGIEFDLLNKKQGRYTFCEECRAVHPWMPTRKFRQRCEILGIDNKKWFKEHYRIW